MGEPRLGFYDGTVCLGPADRELLFSRPAAGQLKLNLGESIMIGDRESDMIAASNAGVGYRILIGERKMNSVATKVVRNHKECIKVLERFFSHDLGVLENE